MLSLLDPVNTVQVAAAVVVAAAALLSRWTIVLLSTGIIQYFLCF